MPDGLHLDFDRSQVVDADLFGTVKHKPEEHFLTWSRKSPFYVMEGGYPRAVLARYEDQKAAYEDFERFSSVKRSWPGTEKFNYYRGLPVITDTDPPAQTRLRRLMAPAFSARKLASMDVEIRNFVDRKLDEICARGPDTDIIAELTQPLAAFILLGLCLDLPEDSWQIFIRISRGMGAFGQLAPGSEPPGEYIEAFTAGRNYCVELIESRRRTPKDDVIGKIVAASDVEGRISPDEMFATMLVLYTAGFGGIANTSAYALWRLCRDSAQLALLQADLTLAAAAVWESIRMDGNAYMILRWATQSFEFEGLQIIEDMPVYLICSAPNYNPDVFKTPLRFDITRKPQELVSFGHGVHHCIGSLLAKLSGRITLHQVVSRFPRLHLPDADFYPSIIGGPKERGIRAMPMRLF